jgi:hypothetical protein
MQFRRLSALAYYYEHKPEIVREIAERRTLAAAIRRLEQVSELI